MVFPASPQAHSLVRIHADFEIDPYGASCTYMSNGTMSYRGFGMVSSVWPYGTMYGGRCLPNPLDRELTHICARIAGDVIGCGFLKRDHSLFFTQNGVYLGIVSS